MSFDDHIDAIAGMPGWELLGTEIESVVTEFDHYFRVRVKGTKNYDNRILLNPIEAIRLLSSSEDYEEAKTATKTRIKELLRNIDERGYLHGLYSPDHVLEGLWLG